MTTKMGRLEVPAMGICFHHYYAAKMNQREQLRRIRDLGFEVINTEESPVEPAAVRGPWPAVMAWNHIEIGENKYDWSFHDHLVEDCAAVGLKLITDVFVPFHLPDWVAEKYGDTDFIQPDGRRSGRYQRPFAGTMYEMRNFSLAHEGAAAAAADFMHKLAARYKGSETVVGHNLFQELGLNYPHSHTWFGQDVSEPALAGFEKFLQRHYSSLDELNKDWRRTYSSFAQAARDREIFRWDGSPHRGWQRWIEWRAEYCTKFFRGMHDAVKAADPEALTTISAASSDHVYSVCQGISVNEMGFVDMVADKSFGGWGAQDGFRWMYTDLRICGADVALSNVNSYANEGDIPVWDLGRRILASIGMGSKWNSLYGWHWFTHLDKAKGVRVAHDNLTGFAPWIDFLREHRTMFAQARPPKSEVAVLAPGHSDVMMFWRQSDPRMSYQSHPNRRAYALGGETIDYARDVLGAWSVAYDLLTEQMLIDGLDGYKLLVLGEPCISEALAHAIQVWLKRGGKLVLLPNAARFDDRGEVADWFGPKLPQQNVTVRFFKDYAGWEKDAKFPFDASVLLLERQDALQIPDILKWAGAQPVLTFIDPPLPTTQYDMGSCREAEVTNFFYWRDHVSAYEVVDKQGRRIYVLVRRGRETEAIKDLPIVWTGGPVTLYLPPNTEPVKLAPANGKLVLPPWQDVAILVC